MLRALPVIVRRFAFIVALAVAHASAGAARLGPGDYTVEFPRQGLARSYLLHVPPQASGGRALPLVMNFHGAGSNAEVVRAYTRMDGAADRDGYVAVYPNGSSGFNGRFLTWNAGNCCGPAAALQVDDVGFALAVIDDVSSRVSIDAGRVYATGLSNGAMMAYRLAAEAANRIAAVAGVAGTMSLTRFGPSRPVPLMHIHSTDDPIALYDGGFALPAAVADTRMFLAPVEAFLGKWLDFDGCSTKPSSVKTIEGKPGSLDDGQSAIRRVYSPCRLGSEVVLWQLAGVGHAWPGGIRDYNVELLGRGTSVIDANTEIWKFFSRFRR